MVNVVRHNQNIKLYLRALVLVGILVVIFSFVGARDSDRQPTGLHAYLLTRDKSWVGTLHKINLDTGRIVATQSPLIDETFPTMNMRARSLPQFGLADQDSFFVIEKGPNDLEEGGYDSYLLKIAKDDLTIMNVFPFGFMVTDIRGFIPEQNIFIADGEYCCEKKFVTYGDTAGFERLSAISIKKTYQVVDDSLVEIDPIEDLESISLDYVLNYRDRLVRTKNPYSPLKSVKKIVLSDNIDAIYNFGDGHYSQSLVFPDEQRILLAADKLEDDQRHVVVIDAANTKDGGREITQFDPRSVKPRRVLALSHDAGEFYMFENYEGADDHIKVYAIETEKLINDIAFEDRDIKRITNTQMTSGGEYLVVTFSEEDGNRFMLILDTITYEFNIVEEFTGETFGLIAD